MTSALDFTFGVIQAIFMSMPPLQFFPGSSKPTAH